MLDNPPTTIASILRSAVGARYLGDDYPRWRQGRDDRRSKTIEEAAHERDLLAKALRRDGSERALDLAAVLDACSSRRPCTSGGCPTCTTAAQRAFVDGTRMAFGDPPRASVVANVVYVRAAVRDGDLDGRAFDALRRKLEQALADCSVPAFGGFDISANRHERGDFEPFWSPHARIFASARLGNQRFEGRFRRWFPPDGATPRPVRIERFDGKASGRAYALKPDFFERISLERGWMADGSRSTYSTRLKPIWSPRRVELALALHQAGLDARLYLRGFELIARNGRAEIVRSPQTPSRLGQPGSRGNRDDRPKA
jgi:hypothetical protein